MSIRIGDNVLNNGGTATFNGTNLTKIIYDGTTVWEAIPSLCVTMTNELTARLSSAIEANDTLCVSTTTSPAKACVKLESSFPISDSRTVCLQLCCSIAFCASGTRQDGTKAYVDITDSPRIRRSAGTYLMNPNTTLVNTYISLAGLTTNFTSDQYDVCPASATLPRGINVDYQLVIHDSLTDVTCTVPWTCGCTVVLP